MALLLGHASFPWEGTEETFVMDQSADLFTKNN